MKRAPVLACAAFLGCGSPAPPVRPPLAPAVVAETAVAAAAPFEWPAALEAPVNPACTLRAEVFPTELFEDPAKSNRSLRFTPESVPFAYVYRGKNVELALPAGDAKAGGMLSLDADGVSVRGILVG